jgi:outer membrane protein assembly factor BamD
LNPIDGRPGRILAIVLVAAALCAAPGCAAHRASKKAARSPEEAYRLAVAKIAKKRYYTARTLLQDALPRIAPDDRDLLPRVQIALADAFYLDGGLLNYGEALNAYRNFLTFFPKHEKADYAQYMVGMSMFEQVLAPDRDQALTLKAMSELHKVEVNYPFSPYVQDARQTIQDCLNRLAEHERLVGWFYQRREIYGAAIDRYRYVLERYPRYDRMNRLLFDLVRSLLAVGSRVEAEEVLGRLSREAPDSKLAARGKKMLAEYDRKRAREDQKAGLR